MIIGVLGPIFKNKLPNNLICALHSRISISTASASKFFGKLLKNFHQHK